MLPQPYTVLGPPSTSSNTTSGAVLASLAVIRSRACWPGPSAYLVDQDALPLESG